jgi:1,4-alpha-glucan branching enzyme
MNRDSGWSFCGDLTSTLRPIKPRLLHNAEFWPGEVGNYPESPQSIVTAASNGGTRCNTTVCTAPFGERSKRPRTVDFDAIAGALYPNGFAHAWQTVPCVENHDIVKVGTDQRIPFLADSIDRRSLVRAQPVAIRDRDSAHGARHSTDLHGSGVS